MEISFLLMLALSIYGIIGYPLLLLLLSKLAPKRIHKAARDDIFVTLIIAAYNEEEVIADKIRNSLELDYPKDRFEIIVASDSSSDKTDEIVRGFASEGVILNRVEGRKGKTVIQNESARIAKGDILLFSDANAFYDRNAVRMIVRNFNDSRVGGVCGRLVYTKDDDGAEGEGVYWKFENLLKEYEGRLSSVLGANGSIYAILKDIYVPLRADLISDLVEPLKIVEKGYRVVYEREAISREDIGSVSGSRAFQRKVRINTRTILGLLKALRLLNVFRFGFVSFQYLSHKILRYLMPFVLAGVFFLNLLIARHDGVWAFLFIVQCVLYSCSLVGFLFRTRPNQGWVLRLTFYFVWTHVAILFAWFHLMRGERKTTWQTVR